MTESEAVALHDRVYGKYIPIAILVLQVLNLGLTLARWF